MSSWLPCLPHGRAPAEPSDVASLPVGPRRGPDRLGFHLLLILSEENEELRKERSVVFGHQR